MRVWFAAAAGSSAAGKWIWRNKVLGSTFHRSPKLLANIQKRHFRPIWLAPEGELAGGLLTMPRGRAIPFIRRLTKGLLYTFHPDYDYFPDFFTVDYRLPTPDAIKIVTQLVSHLPQVAVGNDVFRVWHGITADTGDAGVCVYLFYDAVCFICFHGKQGTFSQKFDEGYEEEKDLPQYL